MSEQNTSVATDSIVIRQKMTSDRLQPMGTSSDVQQNSSTFRHGPMPSNRLFTEVLGILSDAVSSPPIVPRPQSLPLGSLQPVYSQVLPAEEPWFSRSTNYLRSDWFTFSLLVIVGSLSSRRCWMASVPTTLWCICLSSSEQ